jgi:hypothetical protein
MLFFAKFVFKMKRRLLIKLELAGGREKQKKARDLIFKKILQIKKRI